jgi:hypothetical protein
MTQTSPRSTTHDAAFSLLLTLVVTLLAPLFLLDADGDITSARAAALQTVTAYRAQNHASLLAVAKIIAFGLAALGSLSLSMADDLPIPMILRLRGNANALNRVAERAERALGQTQSAQAADTAPTFNADEVLASVAEAQARAAQARAGLNLPLPAAPHSTAQQSKAQPSPAQPSATPQPAEPAQTATRQTAASQAATQATLTPEQRTTAMWAAAMADIAGEYAAEMATLPPAQRKAATLRANALSTTANALLTGAQAQRPRPGDLAGLTRPPPR